MYTCTLIFLTHTELSMYACMFGYAPMCMCMYVSTYLHICIYKNIYIHTHTYIQQPPVYIHTHIPTPPAWNRASATLLSPPAKNTQHRPESVPLAYPHTHIITHIHTHTNTHTYPHPRHGTVRQPLSYPS